MHTHNLMLRRTVLLCAGAWIAFSAEPALAQGSAASGPDVVGFRPGTALQDAYNALKAHNPKLQVQAGEQLVPEISDKKLPFALVLAEGTTGTYGEKIQLDITFPPGRQAVWKVNRLIDFQPGSEPAITSLLAALREKYGPEYPPAQPVGAVELVWLFDERGQRITPAAGSVFVNCRGMLARGEYTPQAAGEAVGLTPPNAYLLPQLLTDNRPAFAPCKSMTVVRGVLLAGADSRLAMQMGVALTDIGFALRAQQATYDQIVKVQTGQDKQKMNKAQQRPVPKL